MAKMCETCGRGAATANSRSHSNIASKRRQHLNLQTKTIEGRRTKMCTRCIRSASKAKN